MMTTMAALLGGLPLALGIGIGSELRRPLGIAIVGGLIVSQMLTLYTTPVIYLYLDRFRLWSMNFFKRGRRAGMAAPPTPAGAEPSALTRLQRAADPGPSFDSLLCIRGISSVASVYRQGIRSIVPSRSMKTTSRETSKVSATGAAIPP